MNYEQAKAVCDGMEQSHLLAGWDMLSEEKKQALLLQIDEIDWSVLKPHTIERGGDVSPLPGLSVKDIESRRSEFYAEGERAIKAGKVGAVMLAGGQGSRLGSSGPKGAHNIGVTRPVYIFERQISNLMDVCNAVGAYVPLFIMTSDKNDEETRSFLKEHSYFGYPEAYVTFFKQDMAPCTNFEGKVLWEEEGKIAMSPNGNGGWFSSMKRAGIVERMKQQGVEWLNVFAVDNVLQRIADPVFVGATLLSKQPCGAKTVKKNHPRERVGVLCERGGIPDIIEYFELSDELAHAKDENGELLYGSGVILNYLFRVSVLEEVSHQATPVHRAVKKVPYFDGEKKISPETENAYKYETLIVDMIRLMGGCISFDVVREREFAPVKNQTGVDSVESARELLKQNGVKL